MNIRKIVTYNALRRQFTSEELAFADVLFNATESERDLLITALQPEKPATKKTNKPAPRKIQHCAVCNWTKRAALHKDTTRDDYHEFVTSQPEPKPSERKSSKKLSAPKWQCADCDHDRTSSVHHDSTLAGYHPYRSSLPSSKSPRASGMAAQLKERRQEQREPMTTKDDNYDPEAERCTFVRGDGKLCYLLSDHNVHHMKTHPGYHPFQPSTTAPPAPARSPANGEADSSTQNLEAGAASAGVVTGGSNE